MLQIIVVNILWREQGGGARNRVLFPCLLCFHKEKNPQRSWLSLSSWAAFQAVKVHVSDVTFSNCGCLGLSLRDRWVTPSLWVKDNTDENLCSAQTSVLNTLMFHKSNFWRKTSILPFAGWPYVIFCVCLWLLALMLFFFWEANYFFPSFFNCNV